MADENDIETAVDSLSEKSRGLLLALDRFDEGTTVDTSDLTDETGYGNNSVSYHMRQNVVACGFADHLGRDESNTSDNKPHQYRLTDAGRDAIAHLREEGSVASTEDLSDRVDEVESTAGWNTERIYELEERLDEHQEIIDLVKKRAGRT